MVKIEPDEIALTGKWITCEDRVMADEICLRIEKLIHSYLQEVKKDPSGWSILYRDPGDGRFWELVYPYSELQGGGPPELRYLNQDHADMKYGPIDPF